jgi:hypothetical protein
LRRWVPSYSDASTAERAALWALVEQVKGALEPLLRAAGYEVGFAMGRVTGDRHELLAQADATFRRLLSAADQPTHVGWCAGDLLQLEPLVVVASVQKLARPENLQRVLAAPPDYIIVDEVHHADAPTYRRVLDALDPAFLLGCVKRDILPESHPQPRR